MTELSAPLPPQFYYIVGVLTLAFGAGAMKLAFYLGQRDQRMKTMEEQLAKEIGGRDTAIRVHKRVSQIVELNGLKGGG